MNLKSMITLSGTLTLLNKNIDVPYICQNPDFPTGCEAVSTVMMLKYHGCDIDTGTFIDKYLPTADKAYPGVFYDAFLGNPRSKSGMLCFPSVITKAVNDYFEKEGINKTCIDATGTEFNELLYQVANDNPCVIWVTTDYSMPHKRTGKYGTYYTPNHAVVLTGIDEENNLVYLNDPINGQIVKDYMKLKRIYEAKMKMAVYIKEEK